MKNTDPAARGNALARSTWTRASVDLPATRAQLLAARRRRARRAQPEAPPSPRSAAPPEGVGSLPKAPKEQPVGRSPRRRYGRAWGYRVASGRRAGGRVFGAGRWV